VDEAMLFYTGKLTKKEVYVLAKQILQVQRSMNLDILNAKTPLL
jgi:hypothetical protein